jgi:uncharacterized protein YecT (DUF1311 family)
MLPRFFIAAICAGIVTALSSPAALAQVRKPTPREVAAIRDCAQEYKDDVSAGEQQCLFNLVAGPCTKTGEGQSNVGSADCYRLEQAIWDELLNQNFNGLRDDLDSDQKAKLRDMQRAWIAYRDTTCGFYYHKIQGSMSVPMIAACLARETARRALLLDFFSRL